MFLSRQWLRVGEPRSFGTEPGQTAVASDLAAKAAKAKAEFRELLRRFWWEAKE